MAIALITGASSGIGQAFLKELLQQQELRLYWTRKQRRRYRAAETSSAQSFEALEIDEIWIQGRREELALQAAEIESYYRCRYFICDLTNAEELADFQAEIRKAPQDFGLAFLAAGAGLFGEFLDLPLEESLKQISLNSQALTSLSHCLLQRMAAGARLLPVASTAAFSPLPNMAVYAATKSYVRSFAAALSVELEPRGIAVTTVLPGTVRTRFFDQAYRYGKVRHLGSDRLASSPEYIAHRAYRDMVKGKRESVWSRPFKLVRIAAKLLPSSWILAGWKLMAR